MTFYQFIFSNNGKFRVTRHLMFWLLYSFYFFIQSIWYPKDVDDLLKLNVYHDALINFACFIPVCIVSVYISMYVLLPFFLKKKRYFTFGFLFILLYLVGIVINYFCSILYHNYSIHPAESEPTFLQLLNLGYINSMAAIIVSGVAIGVKSTKNRFQQQKENLEIAKKKTRTELQLQKAHIHPEFLFRTLNSISAKITSGSNDSSDMVLRLSDFLSYTLYNEKEKLVPIEQELAALHDFMFLEQGKKNKISLQLSGNFHEKYIAPMVILSLLNDSIIMLNQAGGSDDVTLELGTHDSWVNMSLSFTLTEKASVAESLKAIIKNFTGRLETAYPREYYDVETGDMGRLVLIKLKLLAIKKALGKDAIHLKTNPDFYEIA